MFKKNHEFKTSKDTQKSDIRRFILTFVAFVVVFGTVSLVVILKHNNLSIREMFVDETTEETQETLSEDTPTALPIISGEKQIMLYCADSTGKELYFLNVVDVNLTDKSVRVIPLNPDGKTSKGTTYNEVLQKEGGRALADALEKDNKFKIDKYIGSNENTFALAINYLDGIEYNIQNRVEYRNDDYTLILTKGKQTIKGETLLKYFRYCKKDEPNGMRIQGDIISTMVKQYLVDDNFDRSKRVITNVMSKLNSETDITFVESMQAVPTMKALVGDSKFQTKVILDDKYLK